MNLSEKDQNEDKKVDTENGLFIGDTGELELDTRRALVQILIGPSIDERRHSKLWSVLLKDEEIIRKRLSDLFLELIIDHNLCVAFTRQADTGDLEVPKLLRSSKLTFIDSVLLLYLRQQLTQADSRGERAVVSREDITEYLQAYEQSANTDRAGFIKRINASIQKLKDRSILQKIRGSEDRFEISPTLKLLFSAEEIGILTKTYQQMASQNVPIIQNDDINEEDGEE